MMLNNAIVREGKLVLGCAAPGPCRFGEQGRMRFQVVHGHNLGTPWSLGTLAQWGQSWLLFQGNHLVINVRGRFHLGS